MVKVGRDWLELDKLEKIIKQQEEQTKWLIKIFKELAEIKNLIKGNKK